jgi:hypothetical protein
MLPNPPSWQPRLPRTTSCTSKSAKNTSPTTASGVGRMGSSPKAATPAAAASRFVWRLCLPNPAAPSPTRDSRRDPPQGPQAEADEVIKPADRRPEWVAKRHGATFVYIAPSRTWTAANSWFSCRNLGFPFDRAVETAVAKDLRAEGVGLLCDFNNAPQASGTSRGMHL